MKNLMIRAATLHRLSARLVAIAVFAVLLSAIPFHTAFAQTETGSLVGVSPVYVVYEEGGPVIEIAPPAVLGGTEVTCTNFTITGNVGVNPSSVNPSSTVTQNNCTINNGTILTSDEAATAYKDIKLNLYDYFEYLAMNGICGRNLSSDLNNPNENERVLPAIAGAYCFANTAMLEGTLILDNTDNPGAVWTFLIRNGTLTASNFSVNMSNGGPAGNVYWWVSDAATLTDSFFQGTLLAGSDITVNSGTFNGNALALGQVTLTGAIVTKTLLSIAIEPPSAEIDAGMEQQFTATGTYSDGNSEVFTTGLTWTSSSPSVATISASGVATGLAAGTSTITATYGAASGAPSGTAELTVKATTPATLESIAVTPDKIEIVAGTDQQFTATAIYSDGTSEVITTGVTWTTSSPSVASVIRKKGIAKGHTAGTTTITATYGTFSADATVTVTKDKKGKKDKKD
jgi:hypothetical protein